MASYQRGDVIDVPFLIPHTNRPEEHPAIIISNNEVHESEWMYICVMVTHSEINEQFAFELKKDMFINPLIAPDGYVKAHLIAYVLHDHLHKRRNGCRMKTVYVDQLVDFITDNVLKNLH